MSYQVLARKWRPGTFAEMVGQSHVLKALANALDQNRLHHAYLFTGTRGVGKTTIARIFAKCVNCETGISATPCGTCDTCREIADGRFVDLIEIDAASHTGVSEIREILDNVQYAPTRGRYKIYLIDEVHMLSNSSFNALLKTLEEPPPHIKFLLATTDPQKLPITVLSRCLQFNLKNLSEKRIQAHLAHVLTKEGVAYDEEALWEIARSADGSMRDALSLTDQAIAFGEGRISAADVVDMLGTVDRQVGRRLLAHVLAGERADALGLASQLAERSPDWKVLLQGIAELAHRVTLEQTVPGIVDDAQGDQAFVRDLAGKATAEQLQLVYQIALAGIRDLPYAPTPRIGFEMTLVRMLAFTPECPTGVIPPTGGERSTDTVSSEEAGAADGGTTPVARESEQARATEPFAGAESESNGPKEVHAEHASTVMSDVHESESVQVSAKEDTSEPVTPSVAPQETEVAQQGEHTAEINKDAFGANLEVTPDHSKSEVQSAPATVDTAENPDAWRDALTHQSEPDSNQLAPETDQAHLDVRRVPEIIETEHSIEADKSGSDDATDVEALKALLDVRDPWLECYPKLGLRGMTANLCQRLALVRVDGRDWYFEIDPGHSGFLTQMHQARLSDALSQVTGAPVTLHIEAVAHARVTPMAQETARARLNQLHAEAVIQTDPNVKQLIESFEGAVLPGSIRPADRTHEVKHV